MKKNTLSQLIKLLKKLYQKKLVPYYKKNTQEVAAISVLLILGIVISVTSNSLASTHQKEIAAKKKTSNIIISGNLVGIGYTCENDQLVVIQYDDANPKEIKAILNTETLKNIALKQVPSEHGKKYSNGTYAWWTKQGGILMEETGNKKVLISNCRVRA